MIRNTLPPLLQQLVAPAFQLPGDGLNAGDLLDVHYFDTCRHMITKSRVWQFDDQVAALWLMCSPNFFSTSMAVRI